MQVKRVPPYVWVCLVVVVLVALVAGLGKAAGTDGTPNRDLNRAQQLITSAAAYAKAAAQDTVASKKLTDADYGLAYVNAARLLARSDEALERVSGINVEELHATLRAEQRTAQEIVGKP
jgi:Tfp pilus assembly protein FimT